MGRSTEAGVVFRISDLGIVVFGLLWNGFMLLFALAWLRPRGPESEGVAVGAFGLLFLIPFFAIGLYMLPGRFVVDAAIRKRTFYGITNQRAIIVGGGLLSRNTVTSLVLRTLNNVVVHKERHGRGSITFGTNNWYGRMYGGWWPGVEAPPSFELVENVQDVYRVLVNTQGEASGAR